MNGIELGICDQTYSIRITEKLKKAIDRLAPAKKKELKDEILIAMAKVCHRATFNPATYLED